MLTVSDVATRLNVAESAIYALVEAGKIAVHRIGRGRGTLRISEDDLQRYLANCRDEGQAVVSRPRRTTLKHLRT